MQSTGGSDIAITKRGRTWQPDGGDSLVGAGIVAVGLALMAWFVDWQMAVAALVVVTLIVTVAVAIASAFARSLRRGFYNGCRWTLGLFSFGF